jgi:hypothetical protein
VFAHRDAGLPGANHQRIDVFDAHRSPLPDHAFVGP